MLLKKNVSVETLRSFTEQRNINYFYSIFLLSSEAMEFIFKSLSRRTFPSTWLLQWPFQISKNGTRVHFWMKQLLQIGEDWFVINWDSYCYSQIAATVGATLLIENRGNSDKFLHNTIPTDWKQIWSSLLRDTWMQMKYEKNLKSCIFLYV